MHIFIAGATGAVGRALIPLLIADGHTVTGTTRSDAKADELRALGADAGRHGRPRPASVMAAVDAAAARRDRPPDDRAGRHRPAQHRQGVRHHQPAAHRGHRAPARRRARQGARAASRSPSPAGRTRAPAARSRPRTTRSTPTRRRASARPTPRSATSSGSSPSAGGIVLRYGGFYGPGTGLAPGGEQVGDGPQAQVPARRQRRRRSGRSAHRRRRDRARSPRSSAAARARSTTSSTTSPRPCASGCRASPTRSAPSRRASVPAWLGAARRRARPR